MRITNVTTGKSIIVSRYVYDTEFRDHSSWKDTTPPRTRKQIESGKKFVRLGKLYRTKANLQEVVREFGSYHGIFLDAINGLAQLAKESK